MDKRKLIIIFALVAMAAIAGCSEFQDKKSSGANSADDIGDETNIDVSGTDIGASYYYEVKVTEQNQMNLVKEHSPFLMDNSLERQNLIDRYKYLNDRTNTHHVYLMDEGQVVSYFVAQGKVSSVNSKLTNDVQIVRADGCSFDNDNGAGGSDGACYKTVESPQMDGSYGTNGEAIFFFTTEGTYVESSLDYVVSEEPKNIQDEVILVDANQSDGS